MVNAIHKTLATALSLATAALLAGCPCDSGYPVLFSDELHAECGGLPCGWDLTTGEARFVPFLHKGERALELSARASLTHPLSGLSAPGQAIPNALIYVLARCDTQTGLLFELAFRPSDTPDAPTTLLLARLEAGAPDDGLPLPRRTLPMAPVDDPSTLETSASYDLLSITVRVEGPGRCTLDDLHLARDERILCLG